MAFAEMDNAVRHEEAIMCFDKALEIDPRNSFAYHEKSESLLKLVRKQAVAECMKLADKFGVTL